MKKIVEKSLNWIIFSLITHSSYFYHDPMNIWPGWTFFERSVYEGYNDFPTFKTLQKIIEKTLKACFWGVKSKFYIVENSLKSYQKSFNLFIFWSFWDRTIFQRLSNDFSTIVERFFNDSWTIFQRPFQRGLNDFPTIAERFSNDYWTIFQR